MRAGSSPRCSTPLARWLLKIGVSPDAITIVGTAGVVVGALVFYPLGQLWWGTLFITAFIFSDVLDGIMARLQERGGRWGNFLDSTLDRVADGALFAGLAIWFFTGGEDRAIAVCRRRLPCPWHGGFLRAGQSRVPRIPGQRGHRRDAPNGCVSVLVVTGFTGLGLPPAWSCSGPDPARRRPAGHHRPADATVHRQPWQEPERHGLAAACLIRRALLRPALP